MVIIESSLGGCSACPCPEQGSPAEPHQDFGRQLPNEPNSERRGKHNNSEIHRKNKELIEKQANSLSHVEKQFLCNISTSSDLSFRSINKHEGFLCKKLSNIVESASFIEMITVILNC